MNIEDKIETVCRSIDQLTYHFNDWTRANVALDNIPMPVLVNLLPVAGVTSIKADRVRESRECMFAFLDLASNDDTAVQQQSIVSRMRVHKLELIKAINDSGYFVPIEGDVLDRVVTDKLDVDVAGIVVEVKLTEKDGRCFR